MWQWTVGLVLLGCSGCNSIAGIDDLRYGEPAPELPEPEKTPVEKPIHLPEPDGGPIDMVLVEAGPFVMGCADELDVQCEGDERPRRTVELDAFYIDRTEVTQRAWKDCMERSHCGELPCPLDLELRADHPVTCVTWEQADNYCRSNRKRLPTEAEWEKAARGLYGGRYPWGSDETPYCSLANFQACNLPTKTAEVDRRPEGASVFGALDMAGNVYEWVADWHAAYDPAITSNPLGPETGLHRVLRGGDYGSDAWALRSFNRRSQDPTGFTDAWGFRCAADAN